MPTPYHRLETRFAKIAKIEEVYSILQSDSVSFMPKGGAVTRGEQQALLAGIAHEILIEPQTADNLAAAENDEAKLDTWQSANLRLMRRRHARAMAVPADLLDAKERAASACEMAWRDAKQNDDFSAALASLTTLVKLTCEEATALSAVTGLSVYDTMLDQWQEGITSRDIDPIFDAYRTFLKDALPRAEEIQKRKPAAIPLQGEYPVARQAEFCRKLSASAGLDYNHARLDESSHPQSGGTPQDARITTRYDEHNPLSGLMAVMHETGHALYEQGRPEQYWRQPVGHAAGMATHESQSLFIEVQVVRSNAYLGWLGQQLHSFYGGDAATFTAANLAQLTRHVGRGYIRVGSDPLTYPAHVMLRYNLEKAIVSGDLKLPDLPGAWNEGLKNLLGLTPPNDQLGCLQDIHWYVGSLGYFPSYVLGAMAAAQFMQSARAVLPQLDDSLARGDLAPLLAWQRKNIHGVGSLYGFNDLLRSVTGKPLDPGGYQKYLTELYLS